MRPIVKLVLLLAMAVAQTPASASETITYSYDALGRLVATSHSGSVNSGLQSNYSYDPADNRSNVMVTGASGQTGRVIVVPLGGLMVIPIGASQ